MIRFIAGFLYITWKPLKRAAYLKENIIECGEVKAIASSHLPGLLSEMNLRCRKATIGQVYLIAGFQDKSDMETSWIWLYLLISESPRVAQNEREAMLIVHDGDCILFSVQELEIEAILKEGACFGEVFYTEIEVVELHKILLR